MVICAQGQPPPHADWSLFVSGLLFSYLAPYTTQPAAADGTEPYSRPVGLHFLFKPIWLGSLHVALHTQGPGERQSRTKPGLLPSHCYCRHRSSVVSAGPLACPWQPQFASVQLVSMGALYTSAGCSPDEYVSHLPAPCPYLVVSSSAGPSFSTGFIKAASGEAQAQGYPTSELYP